ncbi:MAG: hypothetical protein QME64_08360, partial [bacterium]|nr:hypothetical protein [bacterium]
MRVLKPFILSSIWLFLFSFILIPISFGEGIDLKAQIATLEEKGEFTEAKKLINELITKGVIRESDKQEMLWEIERLDRIKKDYSFTKEELLKALKTRIANFSDEEQANWEAENKFDLKVIDGKKYYLGSSISNLIWRYPEIAAREITPSSDKYDKSVWKEYQKIRKAAE